MKDLVELGEIPPEDLTPARPEDYGRSVRGMRAWHGMTLFTLLKVMRGKWCHVSRDRYPVILTLLLNTSFNQLRMIASQIVHEPRARKVRVDPDPVFVIGHWRSGTTWLHQVLMADPTFAAPTAQAVFCPEGFMAGYETLRPLTATAFPGKRGMDNVSITMDTPEEDEWAVALSGGPSALLNLMFPLLPRNENQHFLSKMTPEQVVRWRKIWTTFLRRVQYINPGKRLLLKSPGHTARIQMILEYFPNARFVMIVRDPYAIMNSALQSRKAMQSIESLQSHIVTGKTSQRKMFERFATLLEKFVAQKHLIPEGHLVTVRYEDLRADVTGTIRHIYETLDLGDYEKLAPRFEEQERAGAGYKNNTEKLPPQLIPEIDAVCGPYFDLFGYKRMSEREDTPS